jgi:hypothetical protein
LRTCCATHSPAATTQCDILTTGICTGWFATYDPCHAWPQYNYAPCGIQLKVPKKQQLQITPAGGFDVWLDMRTSDRKCMCTIARRRRRILQDLLGTTLSKPSPTLQGQQQQIVQTTELIADSPAVNDTKPTADASPSPEPSKPEPLDSPKPYPSTEPQPGSSPFPLWPIDYTLPSPVPIYWWWYPSYSPPPGALDSPKPYPYESLNPNTKPLESPSQWISNPKPKQLYVSPTADQPTPSPSPEPQMSPGMNPNCKP